MVMRVCVGVSGQEVGVVDRCSFHDTTRLANRGHYGMEKCKNKRRSEKGVWTGIKRDEAKWERPSARTPVSAKKVVYRHHRSPRLEAESERCIRGAGQSLLDSTRATREKNTTMTL